MKNTKKTQDTRKTPTLLGSAPGTSRKSSVRASVIPGNIYGRLTVTGEQVATASKGGRTRWHVPCLCECGTVVVVEVYGLTGAKTKSCGCLNAETLSKRLNARNGGKQWTKEPMYHIWTGMKDRCFNETAWAYFYYGAKGIRVCDEWSHSFPAFRDWAYANGYEIGLSIDRIDSTQNYCPENCRWVTRSENSLNCSFARMLTAFGETKSMSDWVRDDRCQVSLGTLSHRLNKMGMSDEEAVATPRGTRSTKTGKFALKP